MSATMMDQMSFIAYEQGLCDPHAIAWIAAALRKEFRDGG